MLKKTYTRYFGRTLPDDKSEKVFMDWSLSGFEVSFKGSRLECVFEASNGIEPSGRFGAGSEPQRPLWPIIAVFVDEGEMPAQTIMIDEAVKTVTVFNAGADTAPAEHRVKILKLTENLKSGLAVKDVWCDGTFLPIEDAAKPVIEVIGDSITCGFGNISPDPAHAFFAEEENAWMAYGAILARKLGMTPQFVSTSGACLALHEWNGRPYGLRDLYEYADRPREDDIFTICPDSNMDLVPDGLPETKARKWDFKSNPVDTIVINLGTNDADGCNFYPNPSEKALEFEEDYLNFLRKVRELNGSDVKIICALGDMRYYLWENIRSAVLRYIGETGDEKIRLIKLDGIKPGERRGAGTHPSVDTDIRMAEQLYKVATSF